MLDRYDQIPMSRIGHLPAKRRSIAAVAAEDRGSGSKEGVDLLTTTSTLWKCHGSL